MSTETQTTIDGFIDDVTDGPSPLIVDRSTLERWATCPHQAAFVDRRMVSTSSAATDVGNEVHRIIGEAVRIRATDGITPNDMREFINAEAMASRPDVQPEVIRVLRKSFALVGLICYQPNSNSERNPQDLMRYDGGEGSHSGQLAYDILPATSSRGSVRLTAEVDLLMSTVSVEELDLWDWKSGRKWWTASEVYDSFQFQTYAALVMLNFPIVQRVRVRVFMTAYGEATAAVEFTRFGDLTQITKRLVTAAEVLLKFNEKELEQVTAWPAPEKCSLCPAARFCVEAHKPAKNIATDPEGAVRQLAAMEAAAASLRADLSSARRKRGEDFVFDGIGYGIDKPRTARAPTSDVYELHRESDFGTVPGETESVGKGKK